jgi:hypothetical protein
MSGSDQAIVGLLAEHLIHRILHRISGNGVTSAVSQSEQETAENSVSKYCFMAYYLHGVPVAARKYRSEVIYGISLWTMARTIE